jgi:hypothetical protein
MGAGLSASRLAAVSEEFPIRPPRAPRRRQVDVDAARHEANLLRVEVKQLRDQARILRAAMRQARFAASLEEAKTVLQQALDRVAG